MGQGATPRKLADPGAKRQASKRYQLLTVYVKLRLPNRESRPRGEGSAKAGRLLFMEQFLLLQSVWLA
jgi:hypothetical protein